MNWNILFFCKLSHFLHLFWSVTLIFSPSIQSQWHVPLQAEFSCSLPGCSALIQSLSYSNTILSVKAWLAFLVSTYNKNEPGSTAIMIATPFQVYGFINKNSLTAKKSPSGFTCITNIHTRVHKQEISALAAWQREGSHSCVRAAHSPALQDAGTQPWPSSTRSWYAATAELCRELGSRELVPKHAQR